MQPAEPGRRAHLRLRERLRRAERLVDGGEHHVLEQLGVVGVDRLRIDLDLADLARAGRLDGDDAAARRRLDRLVRELVLHAGHLLLHLLRLLQQLVHVEAALGHLFVHLSRVEGLLEQRDEVVLARRHRLLGSSRSRFSPSTNTTPSLRPVTW